MTRVWQRLKAYIDREGIDIDDLAYKIGVPEYEMRESLNGERILRGREYACICNALGKPFDFFLECRKG